MLYKTHCDSGSGVPNILQEFSKVSRMQVHLETEMYVVRGDWCGNATTVIPKGVSFCLRYGSSQFCY